MSRTTTRRRPRRSRGRDDSWWSYSEGSAAHRRPGGRLPPFLLLLLWHVFWGWTRTSHPSGRFPSRLPSVGQTSACTPRGQDGPVQPHSPPPPGANENPSAPCHGGTPPAPPTPHPKYSYGRCGGSPSRQTDPHPPSHRHCAAPPVVRVETLEQWYTPW